MLVAKKKLKKKSTRKKHSILIVDDHPVVRYGIARIINSEPGWSVCGEAENGSQTVKFMEKKKPDAIILDISLEGVLDGLILTKVIRAKYPSIPILILSMHDELIYAPKSLSSGANGYIMKEESSGKLVQAIKDVLNGEIYVSEQVKKQMLQALANPQNMELENVVDMLSDRERQVFLLLGTGQITRDIADKLGVSVKTVETHRSRIKGKLGITTSPELVLAAASWVKREGMTPPSF